MKLNGLKMTTAEFAKLHGVNKRTLHYYDKIGLFSPMEKGENKYRYYDFSQNIEFEYIRMLREINMSIEEIQAYLHNTKPDVFLKMMEEKQKRLEEEIEQLKRTENVLQRMEENLKKSMEVSDMEIEVIECKKAFFLTTPYSFEEDDLAQAFQQVQATWNAKQYRMGIGSYLSLEKIKAGKFDVYDGLFTPVQKGRKRKNLLVRPKGKYLCGYLRGSWEKLPQLYRNMLAYAGEHQLTLTGYAYEAGLNDFAISDMEEYVTQVLIQAVNEKDKDS